MDNYPDFISCRFLIRICNTTVMIVVIKNIAIEIDSELVIPEINAHASVFLSTTKNECDSNAFPLVMFSNDLNSIRYKGINSITAGKNSI